MLEGESQLLGFGLCDETDDEDDDIFRAEMYVGFVDFTDEYFYFYIKIKEFSLYERNKVQSLISFWLGNEISNRNEISLSSH